MFELSGPEAVVFTLVVLAQTAAGVVAALQLGGSRRHYEFLHGPFVLATVILSTVLLTLRGMSIQAVPLTDLFDSLIVLALVFGVLYLLLKSTVEQVWFGSVMIWAILGIVLIAALVAKPASRARELAGTPWAVAHASAMILATAATVFAAANSALYLLGSYRLKHKRLMCVLGRIPNMETLARMNRIGVRVGFALLTAGVIGGLGLAHLDGTGIAKWLADVKVICIILAWFLLGTLVILDRLDLLKVKARAYGTMVAFGLLLIAIIGVSVAGATRHRFSEESVKFEVRFLICESVLRGQTSYINNRTSHFSPAMGST
jgi:ABC-type uncharacterized transport system permease subunit